MRIVFSGTQSVGKTTLIHDVLEAVPEYAHRAEPIRLMAQRTGEPPPSIPTMAAEERLIEFGAAMMDEEPRGAKVLYDRGPLDAYAHAVHSMEIGGDVTPRFLRSVLPRVRAGLQACDLVVYVPLEACVPNIDDGFRYLDSEGRTRVDAILASLLCALSIPHVTVRGARSQRLKQMVRLM